MRELRAQRQFATVRMGHGEDRLRATLFKLGLLAVLGTLFVSFLPYDFRSIGLDEALERFMNAPGVDPLRWYNDQWTGHAVAYGAVGFLLSAGFMQGSMARQITGAVVTLAICFTMMIGAEIGQAFVIGRGVTANDVAASAVGAILGVGIWALFGRDLLRLGVKAGGAGLEAERESLRAGAAIYAIAYGVFLFFPFDFALSLHAISALVAEGKPILSTGLGDQGGIRILTRAVFELIVAAPIGLLVAHWRGGRALLRVSLLALAVGFGAEIAQFFVKTGQSTLLSAVMRSAGVVAGWWLIGAVQAIAQKGAVEEARVRLLIKVAAVVALPFYLALLVALDGWQKGSPIGFGTALSRLAEVNWLPFYYHYQGDEVTMLVSALANVALYLPAGLAVWVLRGITVRRPIAWTAAILAALLAAAIEFGGLVMGGLRPDPTNIWLAALGGALGGAGGAAVWRWIRAAISEPLSAGHQYAKGAADNHEWGIRHVLAVIPALAALFVVLGYPGGNGWLFMGLVAYAVLLWRHPSAWLVAIPAALPVLDFSVLSGRDFLDCFDAMLMVTVAVLLIRRPPRWWDVKLSGAAPWIIGALAASYAVSVLIGLFPLPPMDANFWISPWGSPQTLKVAKGFVWALVLYPFLARALKNDPRGLLLLAYGMITGLALTVGVVLWERFLFTGLFNVGSSGYRVVGAFTTMRTGGAHIDGYLAAILPFLAVMVMASEKLLVRVTAAALLVGGLYAVFVTFSRGPYLAVLVAALVLGVSVWVASRRRSGRFMRFAVLGMVGAGLLGAAAIPFLSDSFLAKRFGQLGEDSGIRFSHWSESLDMMDRDFGTTLFGMGPGRYPDIYRQRNPDNWVMGTFAIGEDAGNSYLRLSGGRTLYVSQFVRVRPHTTYSLRFLARSNNEKAVLTVPICEKWVTDSFDCAWTSMRIGDTGGQWKAFERDIDMKSVSGIKSRTGWIGTRPVKMSLMHPNQGSQLDITNIQLLEPRGYNRIDNGDFSGGMDYWYFTVDDHLPWHIKNLFVGVWFDQGVVGLALFVGLLGLVVFRLLGQVMNGERFSAVLLASLTGYLIVGIIGSLFDAPRLTLLFYMLVFTSLLTGEMMGGRRSGRAVDDGAGPAQDNA